MKHPRHLDSIAVTAVWDAEAHVFVATSDQVPGLVAEAETLDELSAILALRIPEMLELNDGCFDHEDEDSEVPLRIISEWTSKVRVPA